MWRVQSRAHRGGPRRDRQGTDRRSAAVRGVQPDPGSHLGVWHLMGAHRSVVIEADGGSRGNPGKAAYGAVLMDAQTREVIAEAAECIGIATNNVAEYRGLVAGLELYREHTPEADLEVRMDSKLVVEQMSGNWKIKHPDMKPLAMQASRLAPSGTTYTWIPRELNKHADRILNEALDAQAGKPARRTRPDPAPSRDAAGEPTHDPTPDPA